MRRHLIWPLLLGLLLSAGCAPGQEEPVLPLTVEG